MLRTHLAMGVFIAALFWSSVSNRIIFLIVLLIATIIPDIDNANSYISNKTRLGKIVAFFSKHRGAFHSITFAILFSLIVALFSTSIALPVFLGYAIHILADSFTKEGVQAFWPFGVKSKGIIVTGSWTEYLIIGFFLLLTALVIF